MSKAGLWAKMFIGGGIMCIGGPALIYWVSPTEEELFKKYNPELQKRSLENRQRKQEDFEHFVGNLKEYSKSDKPIWEASAEADAKRRADGRAQALQEEARVAREMEKRREEIRRHSLQS